MITKGTKWHITEHELPTPLAIAYLGVQFDKQDESLELMLGYYRPATNKFVGWPHEHLTWNVEQVKCWAAEIGLPTVEEIQQ